MYRRISTGWMKHWDFELLDLIVLEISFFIAYLYRHYGEEVYNQSMYVKLGIVIAMIDLLVVFFMKNYKDIVQRTWPEEVIAVFKQVTMVEVILILYEYVTKEAELLSRTVYFFGWGLSIILMFVTRIALKRVIRKRLKGGKNQTNMMVITNPKDAEDAVQELLSKDYRSYKISCVAIQNQIEEFEWNHEINLIRGKENTLEYIRQSVVDEVYIDLGTDKEALDYWVNIFLSMGVTVHVGMGFLPQDLPNRFVENIGSANVLTTTIKTASAGELLLKRLMDICGAIVGLLMMVIAYIFVAPIIKVQSPGPVFFKQARVGKNGRIFNMYKFRSMYMDAEERKKELMAQNEMSGLMFKLENDPRIIGSEKGPGKGIGNFIRKTSIDELPQFWNVLKGDMSLVGTRPPTRDEYVQYDLKHKIRLSMKPGLTGMWQATGRSDITDFEEVVKLDTTYIENWSLLLDIKLIFMTIGVVIKGKGSK